MIKPVRSGTAVPISYKTRLDERLKIVLDGMPVGVSWARLEDGTIEFMNRRLIQMLGYSSADIPTIFVFFDRVFADPAQRELGRQGALNALGSLQPLEGVTHEVDLRCKDGSVKTVAFGGTVLPDAGWMVATFLDLSDRKERERLMEKLAEEDPLTGLLNRRSFDAALRDVVSADKEAHLILFDLDGFKAVNDRAGHAAGDKLLQAVATELRKQVRSGDVLARIGGDEFGAVVAGDGALTEAIVARIDEAFAKPFQIDGHSLAVGISSGVATYPADGTDPLTLYKAADRKLYAMKSERRRRLIR